MPLDTKLISTLNAIDEQYGGENMVKIFGPTLLTWPTDSSRSYMFTSNTKQTLTLLNPDVPRLATGFENSIGKYSGSFKQLEGSWEVKSIIPKFSRLVSSEGTSPRQIVTVVLYNKRKDLYEMIEKPIAEDLTEKFGYIYNTDAIDALSVGDKLDDPVLYKSTSYDEHMNYRYGKNANVYYVTATDTIEDALAIRRGWADQVKSAEVDTVQVMVNDNDVMLNIYGDANEYKPFPHIGERVVNSMICATRQINKHRLLFDFQHQYMQEVMDTDVDYYVSKSSIIYDINVYYNGDEPFPTSAFYSQLKEYYEDNCQYAQAIYNAATEIKNSGSNYTQNVSYMRSKYKNFNDPSYKWKNKDRAFNHIIIEFKTMAIVPIELGSKIAGRFGNKGVVSRIVDDTLDSVVDMMDDGSMSTEDRELLKSKIAVVDDERMPYYMDGDRKVPVDILLNCSGAVRRLNPVQLMETETNFIAEQVRYKIRDAKTIEEKEDLLFKFLDTVNADQSLFFRNMYDSYDTSKTINGFEIRDFTPSAKVAFLKDVEEHGFYIVRPPHKSLVLDDVVRLYEAFPDIKPVDIYVDLFGIKNRKVIRKGVVGYQYMIILKQNSNKNFSARSTFRVNRSNLPVKDIAKKTNRSSYARTPVKLSEIYNLLASVSATDLAEWNVFMRSSAIGRKSLDRILSSSGNPLAIKKLKIQDNYTNSNVEIMAAKLKAMGLRMRFSNNPDGTIKVYDDDVHALHFGKYVIYDRASNREMYADLFDAFEREFKSNMIIEVERGEKHDYCWDIVFSDPTLTDRYSNFMNDDLKMTLIGCTKGSAVKVLDAIASPGKAHRDITAMDSDSPTPRKRGRKSKAEKERIEQEKLRLEAKTAFMEDSDDSDEDEKEPQINEYEDPIDDSSSDEEPDLLDVED